MPIDPFALETEVSILYWMISMKNVAEENCLCRLDAQLMVSDSIWAIGMRPYLKAIVTGLLGNLEAVSDR